MYNITICTKVYSGQTHILLKIKIKLKYCNKNVSNRRIKLIIYYSVKIVDNLQGGSVIFIYNFIQILLF